MKSVKIISYTRRKYKMAQPDHEGNVELDIVNDIMGEMIDTIFTEKAQPIEVEAVRNANESVHVEPSLEDVEIVRASGEERADEEGIDMAIDATILNVGDNVEEIEMTTKRETEPTSPTATEDLEQPNLGVIQKMLTKIFDFCNAPPQYATAMTIIISLILAISDGSSDIGLAFLLHSRGYVSEALVVVAIDYSAAVVTIIHYLMMAMETQLERLTVFLELIALLLLHPIAPAICLLLWLLTRARKNHELAGHYHYLMRLLPTAQLR